VIGQKGLDQTGIEAALQAVLGTDA
jgi:hypothetical protein